MARPTVRNEEINRKIEEAAALGAPIEAIAFYIGVHKDTLYDWMSKDQELSDRIKELKQRPILKSLQTINKALDNAPDAWKYLEKKLKVEFGNAIDVTTDHGPISGSIDLEAVTLKVEEEIRKQKT